MAAIALAGTITAASSATGSLVYVSQGKAVELAGVVDAISAAYATLTGTVGTNAPVSRGLLLRGVGGNRITLGLPFTQGAVGVTRVLPFYQRSIPVVVSYVLPLVIDGPLAVHRDLPFGILGGQKKTVAMPFSLLEFLDRCGRGWRDHVAQPRLVGPLMAFHGGMIRVFDRSGAPIGNLTGWSVTGPRTYRLNEVEDFAFSNPPQQRDAAPRVRRGRCPAGARQPRVRRERTAGHARLGRLHRRRHVQRGQRRRALPRHARAAHAPEHRDHRAGRGRRVRRGGAPRGRGERQEGRPRRPAGGLRQGLVRRPDGPLRVRGRHPARAPEPRDRVDPRDVHGEHARPAHGAAGGAAALVEGLQRGRPREPRHRPDQRGHPRRRGRQPDTRHHDRLHGVRARQLRAAHGHAHTGVGPRGLPGRGRRHHRGDAHGDRDGAHRRHARGTSPGGARPVGELGLHAGPAARHRGVRAGQVREPVQVVPVRLPRALGAALP